MKIIYVNQCLFTYFLVIFHASKAATHWIVTEDGKIHTQDDSVFQMRRPYDLMSLLQQEKRADVFAQIKSQLLAQKEEIETDSLSDNDDDVEQLVYLTNTDCIKAGRPLIEFDLYVGTLVFTYPKSSLDKSTSSTTSRPFPETFPVNNLHTSSAAHQHLSHQTNLPTVDSLLYDGGSGKSVYTITCSNTSARVVLVDDESENSVAATLSSLPTESVADKIKFGPNCSDYLTLDFSMTTFEHLPSVRERKQLHMDPETEILRIIGKWKSYEEFGRDLSNGLKQNSSSWLLYTLSSFYWRGVGNAERAIECVRRALHTSPYETRPLPLLSLATILHRARSLEEAAIVLHGAIDITPDIAHAHYTLGNIYATLADYNKSVICYENVLKLAPAFVEVTARKAAVLCHSNIENALKAQHDTLQKTLDELKDYQRQQELWINYNKKLRAEQAPPSVLLEQRLHYREFKIRQKLESTFDEATGKFINDSNLKGTNLKSAEKESSNGGPKFHLKFNPDTTNMVDKIVIELDKSAEASSSASSCEEEQQRKQAKESLSKNNKNNKRGAEDSLQESTGTLNNDSNEDEQLNKKAKNKVGVVNAQNSKVNNECRSGGGAAGAGSSSESANSARPILIPVTFVLPPS